MYDHQVVLVERKFLEKMRKVKEYTNKQIEDGINNPFSSTGTLIEDLHGASKFSATLANIGGGSKRTGGNGMEGGLKTIRQRDIATIVTRFKDNKNQFKKSISIEKLLK